MKKRTSLFALLCILFAATQAFALDDICVLGAKAKKMTTSQRKKIFNEIKVSRVQGSGRVRDVREGEKDSIIIVVVDCSRDVIVRVKAHDYSGIAKSKINAGQKISFRGDCIKLKKKFYRDSDKQYIEVTLGDGLLLKY